ncbi:MAG: cytochrome c3 family protein [Thermoanaerobaculaceae bacterium]|nr:cytochrome c3 family protein [Thermoanaerobaculaceae bacterium]MDI9622036.1 cytochrome c3 family protein [Acidobacteriota bacterium]NLH09983.1 cytochrome c3 family protein [Holophagae bacterium]
MNAGGVGGVQFPRWTNWLRVGLIVALLTGPPYLVLLVWLGGSPLTTDVGYQPEQPVPYSHALHVGQLGIDCRYCHTTVEQAGFAAIPPSATCLNCHQRIRTESPKLKPVWDAAAGGPPVAWVKVHDLPDYVYFNHSAHVRRGVGCESCHGRIDRQEVVRQVAPLSMGWCLDCHRDPDPHLRPLEAVTAMGWTPAGDRRVLGRGLREAAGGAPSVQCWTCHR